MVKKTGFSVAMIVMGDVKNDFRVIKTAESLTELGLEVQIFGVSEDSRINKIVTTDLGKFRTVMVPDISLDFSRRGNEFEAWRYKKQASLTNMWPLVNQFNPDIIHSNEFDTLEIAHSIVERLRKQGKQIKWVHDIHNYVKGFAFENLEIRNQAIRDEEKYILTPDLLLTVSEKISLRLMEHYPLSDRPGVIINSPQKYLGGPRSTKLKESLGLDSRKKLVVYSGNVNQSTGLIPVIDAISTMDKEIHLSIISDCEDRYLDEMLAFAEEKGCQDRIHFSSYVDPEEVSIFIQDADVGIHPLLRTENSDLSIPKKVLEYVFAGLPVISSDCLSVSEFIRMWKIGEVFDTSAPEEISQAIKKVISAPGRYSRNITEELLHLHSWEHNKDKISEYYLDLIEKISRNSGREGIFGEISGVEGGLLTGWVSGLGYGYSKCALEIMSGGEVISSVNLDTKRSLSVKNKISDRVIWKAILPDEHYDGQERRYIARVNPWGIECESLESGFIMGMKKPVVGEFTGTSGHSLAGRISVSNEFIDFVEIDVYYNETYICSHKVDSLMPGMKSWSREFIVALPRVFHDNKLRRFKMKFSEWGEELLGSPKLVKFPKRTVSNTSSINEIQVENLIPGGGEWGVPKGKENHGEFDLRLEKYSFSIGERVKLQCSQNIEGYLDVSLFRIGHYGGKNCRCIRSWKNLDSESDSLIEFNTGIDFLPGTYHLVAKDKRGKRQFIPFCLFSPESDARILVVHPNIPNHLFNGRSKIDFEKIAYLDGFEVLENSLSGFSITNNIEGSRSGNYPIWVLNSVHWLEKMGIEYAAISDDLLHYNPSLAMNKDVIIFLGSSRFWTEEIHIVVGHHLSRGKKIAILGSGMGEQIVELDKDSVASLNFSSKEYRSGVPLCENWLETGSPIIYQGFAKESIGAIASLGDDEISYDVGIKGSWDVVNAPNFAEKVPVISFEGVHDFAGKVSIESSIINFDNEAQIFHGGFESWSNSLEIDWVSRFLYSFVTENRDYPLDDSMPIIESTRNLAIEKWGAMPVSAGLGKKRKPVRRVCILTALWGRHDLARLVLTHFAGMSERLNRRLDIEIIAVGSEEESEKLCNEIGINYTHHPNSPLSEKWSIGLKECERFNPDVVMTVGSDDLISDSTLEALCQKISDGRMVVGIRDMYIIDAEKNTLNYWSGYVEERGNETVGMARCYSREILDKTGFNLWEGQQIDRGLDRHASSVVSLFGHFPTLPGEETVMSIEGVEYGFGHVGFILEEISGFAVDIKTEENISKVGDYGVMSSSTLESNITLLKERLGEDTVNGLISLLGEKMDES